MVERIRLLLETRQLTPTQFADAIGIARPIVSHILSGRNKPSLEVVQRILAAMPDLSMPWLLNGTGTMLAAAVASIPPPPVALSQPAVQTADEENVVSKSTVAIAATVNPIPSPTVTPTQSRRNGASSVPVPKPVIGMANLPGPKRFALPPKSAPFPVQAAALQAIDAKSVSAPEAPTPEAQAAAPSESAPVLPTALPQPQLESLPPPLSAITAPVSAPADAVESAVPSIAAALFAGAEKPIRRIVIFYRDGSFGDYQPE